jgi:MFS family permease
MNSRVDVTVHPSPWTPFRYTAFSVIWTATVVANIGSWMYAAAAAWLMTTLDSSPVMVSLVQVASTVPVFLFALPAGVLADIVDRRRLLIFAETVTTVLCAAFAVLVWMRLVTPIALLCFVFLIEAAGAMTAAPWQAVVPLLVPRSDLPAAVTMNSVGVNVSRAIGPALGGVLTPYLGLASPFFVNAATNLGIIGALAWWQSPQKRSQLPVERFWSGIRTGLRYARHNHGLRAAFVRAIAFFLFASCYWALIPLVARDRLHGGARLYGVLVGVIGASAILGALALPRLKARFGIDQLILGGSIGTALALTLFGIAHNAATALFACLVAGASWIAALASLNVAAQFALPEWVRGRGLAIYVTVFFGALAVGSLVWGFVARAVGIAPAHFVAAIGMILAIPATWRWRLRRDAPLDLTPSMHWPTPILDERSFDDTGPTCVTVEYWIDPANVEPFLRGLTLVGEERRRDGAYAWEVFRDAADPRRYVEMFMVESWLEHLRQHERVTQADLVHERYVRSYLVRDIKVTHLIAASMPKG